MNLSSYIRVIRDFPKPGIAFRDIAPLLKNPAAFAHTVTCIAAQWRGKADVVAALDARGFLFGPAVAMQLAVPFVPFRKRGKLPGDTVGVAYDLEYGSAEVEIQRDAIAPGQRVLVVDDLLATGGTAAAACGLIEKVGGIVAGCAFVIELAALCGRAKLQGREIQSLITYETED